MQYRARIQLADNILEHMKRQNMSSKELAIRSKISITSISLYINGHREPSFERLGAIARSLGVRVEDLLKGIRTEDML